MTRSEDADAFAAGGAVPRTAMAESFRCHGAACTGGDGRPFHAGLRRRHAKDKAAAATDESSTAAVPMIRSDFADSIFWAAALVTDKNLDSPKSALNSRTTSPLGK